MFWGASTLWGVYWGVMGGGAEMGGSLGTMDITNNCTGTSNRGKFQGITNSRTGTFNRKKVFEIKNIERNL